MCVCVRACVFVCVCVCVCVLIVVSMVMRWDTTSRRRGGSLNIAKQYQYSVYLFPFFLPYGITHFTANINYTFFFYFLYMYEAYLVCMY